MVLTWSLALLLTGWGGQRLPPVSEVAAPVVLPEAGARPSRRQRAMRTSKMAAPSEGRGGGERGVPAASRSQRDIHRPQVEAGANGRWDGRASRERSWLVLVAQYPS